MIGRWRGRPLDKREQVVNARDDLVDLTPASDGPADAVKAAWAPLHRDPDQEVTP